jgi:hypothetical protein
MNWPVRGATPADNGIRPLRPRQASLIRPGALLWPYFQEQMFVELNREARIAAG